MDGGGVRQSEHGGVHKIHIKRNFRLVDTIDAKMCPLMINFQKIRRPHEENDARGLVIEAVARCGIRIYHWNILVPKKPLPVEFVT